jgi:putative mRNA 3-end processing factor
VNPAIELTESGLYCAPGDFFIDPWRPVPRAVVTHAHADHACRGCGEYLTSADGQAVLRTRLGADVTIETLPYGHGLTIGGVWLSLHPAGHVLGSSQVRIEHRGHVSVVSGDYKLDADPTCAPFETVRCHLFLTESTFGLPIYRWPDPTEVAASINAWWAANTAAGRASIVFAYALGKAQRILAGLDPDHGPILTHGAVEPLVRAYRQTGIVLPATRAVGEVEDPAEFRRALVLAPPSAQGSPWMRRFGDASTAFASGWMQIRGARRRRALDRGFVVSDHADWPDLLQAIDSTGAETVWVTHGYSAVLVRWLREQGRKAEALPTRFVGEGDETAPAAEPEAASPAMEGDGS